MQRARCLIWTSRGHLAGPPILSAVGGHAPPGGRAWSRRRSPAASRSAPTTRAPEAPLATEWQQSGDARVANAPPDDATWWRTLNDPVLSALIEIAPAQNPTVQIAGVRVLQARAQLGAAIGELYPQQQQATGSLRYERLSDRELERAPVAGGAAGRRQSRQPAVAARSQLLAHSSSASARAGSSTCGASSAARWNRPTPICWRRSRATTTPWSASPPRSRAPMSRSAPTRNGCGSRARTPALAGRFAASCRGAGFATARPARPTSSRRARNTPRRAATSRSRERDAQNQHALSVLLGMPPAQSRGPARRRRRHSAGAGRGRGRHPGRPFAAAPGHPQRRAAGRRPVGA